MAKRGDAAAPGLGLQLRVLGALILREMSTRFGRSAGGYVWALLEPAATVAALSLLFQQIARHPPLGASFPFYFATGYLAFHVYLDISRAVSLSVRVNRSLLAFPRVTMLDAAMARFALQALTSATVFAVIVGGLGLILGLPSRVEFGSVLLALGLAALLGAGVGMLNCVLFAFSHTWARIFAVVNRPLFLISGVFYNFEQMPRLVQDMLWWNPLIHVTAIMRRGFYSYYEPSFVAPGAVAALGLGLLMLGVLMLRAFRARMLDG